MQSTQLVIITENCDVCKPNRRSTPSMKGARGRAVITSSSVFRDSSSHFLAQLWNAGHPAWHPDVEPRQTCSSSAPRVHQLSKLKGFPKLSVSLFLSLLTYRMGHNINPNGPSRNPLVLPESGPKLTLSFLNDWWLLRQGMNGDKGRG